MEKSFKLTTDTEFYMARNWIKCDKDALLTVFYILLILNLVSSVYAVGSV